MKNKAEEAADSIENLIADDLIKTTAEIEDALLAPSARARKEGLKLAQNERNGIERISKEDLPEGYDTKGGKHYYRAVNASPNDFPTLPPL